MEVIGLAPTVVSAAVTSPTLGTSSSVVCANGNGVDFWLVGGTIRYAVSVDGWASTPGSSTDSTITADNFTVILDDQDNIHVFYMRGTSSTVFASRRLTPNAGRTSWTVSAETVVHSTTYQGSAVDAAVNTEGTGWRVHCLYSAVDGSTSPLTYYALYKMLTITSAGVVTVGTLTTVRSSNTTTMSNARLAMGGTTGKDLVVVWTENTSGYKLQYRKAAYSAGSWTWGSVTTTTSTASLSSTRDPHGVYYHSNGDFDVLYTSSGLPPLNLYHLTRTNGGTETNTTVVNAGVNSAISIAQGRDSFGNLFAYYQTSATGNALVERTYVRSTGVWSAAETVVGTSSSTVGSSPSTKRGYAGNKIDVVFFEGASSPFNIVHYRRSLNTDPLMPSGLSPDGGFAFDGATAKGFGAIFNDADAGAYATAYADEWQENVGGATVIQTGKVAITSGIPNAGQNFSVSRPAGTFANGKDWQWRRQYWDQWDRPSPFSNWATFRTSAPPTTTIISPADGATLNTASVTATWAVSDPESRGQGGYRVRFYNQARTLTLWDTDWISSNTDFARTIGFTPSTLTTYQIGVQTKDADGIAGTEVYVVVSFDYTPPPAPTNLTPTPNKTNATMDLTWTQPTNATIVTGWLVERSEGSSTTWIKRANTVATSYTDVAVGSGVLYRYRVTAAGANGTITQGAQSAATSVVYENVRFTALDGSLDFRFWYNTAIDGAPDRQHHRMPTQSRYLPSFAGPSNAEQLTLASTFLDDDGTVGDGLRAIDSYNLIKAAVDTGTMGYLRTPSGRVLKGILTAPAWHDYTTPKAQIIITVHFEEKGAP
jgi:hypothetical protein